MKAIDIINARPATELDEWTRMLARLRGEWITKFGRKIEVTHLIECNGCGGTAIEEDPMCNNCKLENYCE